MGLRLSGPPPPLRPSGNFDKKEEIKKNVKDNIIIDETRKEIKKDLNKKLGGLTVYQWGWLSMITNLLSVFFQLYNLWIVARYMAIFIIYMEYTWRKNIFHFQYDFL